MKPRSRKPKTPKATGRSRRKARGASPRPPEPRDVRLSRAAERALEKLDPALHGRIVARLHALADDPYPPGVKPLRGSLEGALRTRVSDYRMVYSVTEDAILVHRIAHRSEVYRYR